MIIGYKDRWQYKQINASKTDQEFWCSGQFLNLNLLMYGKNTSYDSNIDPDSGMAIKIFDTFMKDLGTGYNIFAHRWSTNHALVKLSYWHSSSELEKLSSSPQDTKACAHGGQVSQDRRSLLLVSFKEKNSHNDGKYCRGREHGYSRETEASNGPHL
ncbi:hypothetical protein PoB_002283000 [Plakobranchus ocellatus]|uniref:Uncharacterized protein n=1 Tax=Plakobranchus ocellatus TaxID=259542 RepID=A0AAV3ZP19_9GAST|nr:hypothetical protein PoB_002283000 [Plakobranchus ocellatus]